jgi:hypothetical protein
LAQYADSRYNFAITAPVAQMDRARASEARGREFEPPRARHFFDLSLVSNTDEIHLMALEIQFRKILPISQTALAILFGGWGLWVRNSILSRPFVLGMTGWESTARFHVWPWPLKFATVLNMPAFLAGALASWPLDALRPGLPESVSILPVLPFVYLLWYWIGLWLDQRRRADKNKIAMKGQWIWLLVFIAICAAGSSIPESVGGHVSYLPSGIVIWLFAAIGMAASKVSRKHDS